VLLLPKAKLLFSCLTILSTGAGTPSFFCGTLIPNLVPTDSSGFCQAQLSPERQSSSPQYRRPSTWKSLPFLLKVLEDHHPVFQASSGSTKKVSHLLGRLTPFLWLQLNGGRIASILATSRLNFRKDKAFLCLASVSPSLVLGCPSLSGAIRQRSLKINYLLYLTLRNFPARPI
jgi:hypothetical protein